MIYFDRKVYILNVCLCDSGNAGCQGGLPSDAYRYIKANKGIDTENSYPYTAKVRYQYRLMHTYA